MRDVQVDIDPLDLAEQPASLLALRGGDQPDDAASRPARAVLEVHARTGFLTEFTATGGAEPRMAELEVSVAAVLVAETCDVGFKTGHPAGAAALTRAKKALAARPGLPRAIPAATAASTGPSAMSGCAAGRAQLQRVIWCSESAACGHSAARARW